METLSYAILLAALLGGDEPVAQPATPPAEAVRRLALVYTVNNFGNIEPVGCPHKILHDGGLARRMTCLRQIAATGRPMVIVDGGAALFPEEKPPDAERDKLFLKAELIVESMNRMGYQAMAVGTSDLFLGLGELTHLAGRVKFPLLSANFTAPNGAPFKPYTILEAGGVKIGVIGLLVETIGKVYVEKVAPGAKVTPSIPAARKAVEELRGKVDLIVVLSHIRQETNRELAKQVEGIDIIIDPSIEYGNHHPRIKDEEWEEMVGRTAILRADGNGSSLGVVEIDFRRPGSGMASRARQEALAGKQTAGALTEEERSEMQDLSRKNLFLLRRLPLSPHYADDPEEVALFDAWKAGGDVGSVPRRPPASARAEFLTADSCKGCHTPQYENWTHNRHSTALESVKASGSELKPECISCHTTGYGPAFVDPAEAVKFAGVQCEACHGTRPDHLKDPAGHPFGAVAESVCLPCHNEDIVKKDFSFRAALRRVQCPSK